MTIQEIYEVVSEEYEIPVEAIMGRRRDEPVAFARMSVYLIAYRKGFSRQEIGVALGLYQSTIHHGMKRISDLIGTDKILSEKFNRAASRLTWAQKNRKPAKMAVCGETGRP